MLLSAFPIYFLSAIFSSDNIKIIHSDSKINKQLLFRVGCRVKTFSFFIIYLKNFNRNISSVRFHNLYLFPNREFISLFYLI